MLNTTGGSADTYADIAIGICGILRAHGVADIVFVSILDARYARLGRHKQLAKEACQ